MFQTLSGSRRHNGTIDSYATPNSVALDLIRSGKRPRPAAVVADFAAGSGTLLSLADKRWDHINLLATDIDRRVVAGLRKRRPQWMIGCVDFLNRRSRIRSPYLREYEGCVDLILLNPPFSCRGGTRYSIEIAGNALMCSTAMAFVLLSVSYLRDGGELRAILPAGLLSSQKDSAARSYCTDNLMVEVARVYGRGTFQNCFPRTALVVIRKTPPSRRRLESAAFSLCSDCLGPVQILRGSIQMHAVRSTDSRNSVPLIHTCNLLENSVAESNLRVKPNRRSIVGGPVVLLPRVGLPDKRKVCVVNPRVRLALSDCVFGLKCDSADMATKIGFRIREQWRRLEASFHGTGAPYLTVEKLAGTLNFIGIEVNHHKTRGYSQYGRILDPGGSW